MSIGSNEETKSTVEALMKGVENGRVTMLEIPVPTGLRDSLGDLVNTMREKAKHDAIMALWGDPRELADALAARELKPGISLKDEEFEGYDEDGIEQSEEFLKTAYKLVGLTSPYIVPEWDALDDKTKYIFKKGIRISMDDWMGAAVPVLAAVFASLYRQSKPKATADEHPETSQPDDEDVPTRDFEPTGEEPPSHEEVDYSQGPAHLGDPASTADEGLQGGTYTAAKPLEDPDEPTSLGGFPHDPPEYADPNPTVKREGINNI